MTTDQTFAVVGGDQRQVHLANLLADGKQYYVYTMFFDKEVDFSDRIRRSDDVRLVLPQSDVVLFPMPLLTPKGTLHAPLGRQEVSLEHCLEYISPDSVVLGGMVSKQAQEMACAHGIEIIDYLHREEFSVMNAIPTAEGAVELAMRETSSTLFGSTCLVTGFGRISRALVKLLCAFGARVRVAARSHSDLAWAELYHCEAVPLYALEDALKDVDLVFNTVPAVIFNEETLLHLHPDCLVIDLASKPGGVDFETARRLGVRTIWALSLPGTAAPFTAGEIILKTVFHILTERGKVQ